MLNVKFLYENETRDFDFSAGEPGLNFPFCWKKIPSSKDTFYRNEFLNVDVRETFWLPVGVQLVQNDHSYSTRCRLHWKALSHAEHCAGR